MRRENNTMGGFGKRLSAILVALVLLISAVPIGFMMSIGVVGEVAENGMERESVIGTTSIVEEDNIVGSNTSANEINENELRSNTVYGDIHLADGRTPVDSALVIAINMNTGNATTAYAENGTYEINLTAIDGGVNLDDTVRLIFANGVCISNASFVADTNFAEGGKKIDVKEME